MSATHSSDDDDVHKQTLLVADGVGGDALAALAEASYSPSTNSYATHIASTCTQFANQRVSFAPAAADECDAANKSPSNKEPLCRLGDSSRSPLAACLLGAALFSSALNTLLLSFVVKSIQLNDVSSTHSLIVNLARPPVGSVIGSAARARRA